MAERFAEVNEQEIRELLDNTTPKIQCLSMIIKQLYHSLSSYMNSQAEKTRTTQARGIILYTFYIMLNIYIHYMIGNQIANFATLLPKVTVKPQ